MRVMIAFGGKREKGARNEKNELKPLAGAVVVADRDKCEDRRERNVRKTAAMKKETAITARGSRMVGIWSRTSCTRLISCLAGMQEGWLASAVTECRVSSKVLWGWRC